MSISSRVLTENDIYLFGEGTNVKLADVFGAHLAPDGSGTSFVVWAPRARAVSVIGPFNDWNRDRSPLSSVRGGVWQGFVPGVGHGAHYKFHVEGQTAYSADKADPFAFYNELSPQTASVVWNLGYDWNDSEWMAHRAEANSLNAPMSIYEVHLGSWRRVVEEGNRSLTYLELADRLVPYVKEMGFTHVEFLPVMEHPFYGSWGYQITGFYAPTSRYGTPQDFMQLIDRFHQNGIGVILDWVPSHFPQDEFGPGYFDGAHEFEPADPRSGVHPDWNSFIFDYSRNEVRSFLLSSALFWLDKYHADGLRVDAVASMLYLDYSRKPGQWIPNQYGGRENLEAIAFLRLMNEDVYRAHPDVQTIAEESTAWPMVSKPTYIGGLGFGLKWDMGWMHDTLKYLAQDPFFRKYHHHELTFRIVYAFAENFVLPLSHDEVVYGKGSLISKMPGDNWQKFASLRLLLAYMYAQPGKKLLFMGGEFGQWSEWKHDGSLDWNLLEYGTHAGVRLLVGDLNSLYRTESALHMSEFAPESFEWIDVHDSEKNVLSFLRKGANPDDRIAVICNFSPVPRANYRVGVPSKGFWKEVLNTDAKQYAGSGRGNFGGIETVPIPLHGRNYSLTIDLPPLAVVFFRLDTSAS
ncbi:MAG: 1,4-alpha-glucan branching protein GlgB [Acidobacteriaceae bacterium]|nr:1,4-alpha-glucan branching protein GlgB [Acidobacteriaceae bacterium]MBV8571699.1 1,4-alpha-glucan branching protein GlgB [Acidobacteriaceae bacterium]